MVSCRSCVEDRCVAGCKASERGEQAGGEGRGPGVVPRMGDDVDEGGAGVEVLGVLLGGNGVGLDESGVALDESGVALACPDGIGDGAGVA